MGYQNESGRLIGLSLGAVALATVMMGTWAAAAVPAQPPITNALSAFPIEADGAYTNAGEWSDITPAWFTSNGTTGATPVAPGTPGANSLLFAGLSKDATPGAVPELYLMYDYLGRTAAAPPTGPNQFLGSVSFPMTINGQSQGVTVTFQTATPTTVDGFVTIGSSPAQVPLSALGLEGGLTLNGLTPVNALWDVTASSPFHTVPHELIELGVPLDISAAFAAAGGSSSPFPAGGQNDGKGGGYSPDPAFWTSDITDNHGDPPASGGLFQINPDGSTSIIPIVVPLPEPASLGVLMAGGMLFGARSRRRAPR